MRADSRAPAGWWLSRGTDAVQRVSARSAELALLLAVSLPLLSVGLGLSFLDPDEGLYADVAGAMLATGDWLLPRFNGLPYLEKPPLYFWLAALTLGLGGAPEWSLRIWSAIAALGTVLLAWRMGRRLYGPQAGVLAGLVLVTTAGYGLYVRKASTDFVFVFCLTLALYGFLRDAERPERGRGRFLLFYLGAALGLLAKGLIGLLFPALIAGISLLWVRRLRAGELNLGGGLVLAGLVALPWHLLVAWRWPALFWFYLGDNQVLRFLGLRAFVEDDVPVSALGFVVLTLLWLFPWGVFLLARPLADASPAARWRPVLTIWAVVVVGFFVLSRSKLEYYALPAFPALAVLVGAGWAAGRDVGRWLAVGLLGSAVVGGWALWVGFGLTPAQALDGLAELNVYYRILRDQGAGFPFESPRPFGRLLQALGVTLVVGWALAAACWWRGWRRGAFAALVGEGVVIGLLIVQLLSVVEPHHSAKAVAEAIRLRARTVDVVAHEGALEYSAALPFYSGRSVLVVNGARGDLDLASRLPEGRDAFVDEVALARLWAGSRRVFLVTQRTRDRSVVGGLPEAHVHLLGQFGSRRLYSNREN